MKIVDGPNFSIVTPTGCNKTCSFCFWKEREHLEKKEYLIRLKDVLFNLPNKFEQCSITGGEPTMLPWLDEILEIASKRFQKIVLSTNGYHRVNCKYINHLNISYNNLEEMNLHNSPNKMGTSITFNCVVPEGFVGNEHIIRYIKKAKLFGANSVCFRKEHGNLEQLNLQLPDPAWIDECPVCRVEMYYIEGIPILFKYSTKEPSKDLNEIYELILHSDGILSADWAGKMQFWTRKGILYQ